MIHVATNDQCASPSALRLRDFCGTGRAQSCSVVPIETGARRQLIEIKGP